MTNQLQMLKKDTVDVVATRIREFQDKKEINFPANYSPENALKSAWLVLQSTKTGKQEGYKPVLEHCTKDSIANSLLDMVVQGLNPNKKQGYFISYGKNLVFQRSYFGTMAVTKRVANAQSIDANVIYKGDVVDYDIVNGRIVNLRHKQDFMNIDKENILGAYATIVFKDGSVYNEIMTMEEIRQAWSKSQMWGRDQQEERKGSTHEEYRQEMAKKTVINRACKKFLNSSDDGSLMMQHINNEHEEDIQPELEDKANKEELDIIDYEEPENNDYVEAEFTEEEPKKEDNVPEWA